MSDATLEPSGPMPRKLTASRLLIYAILAVSALFFLAPLYVMVVTSLKPMDEVREAVILALPRQATLEPWVTAWSAACTGLRCDGVRVGFFNSVMITVPSVILAIIFGSVNGYALSFWRVPYANVLFGALLIGGFFPYQILVYPLVRISATIGIFNTLAGVIAVHVVFSMPVVTLLFRNYYATLPIELFKAGRVDGAGYWRIFWSIMVPMSLPIMMVAGILQVTFIWNDFLIGLIFGGRENSPMTVQLNNIVGTTFGEHQYNVEMAATLLTSVVPLVVYFISGRWFVRGISAGAVKG